MTFVCGHCEYKWTDSSYPYCPKCAYHKFERIPEPSDDDDDQYPYIRRNPFDLE